MESEGRRSHRRDASGGGDTLLGLVGGLGGEDDQADEAHQDQLRLVQPRPALLVHVHKQKPEETY